MVFTGDPVTLWSVPNPDIRGPPFPISPGQMGSLVWLKGQEQGQGRPEANSPLGPFLRLGHVSDLFLPQAIAHISHPHPEQISRATSQSPQRSPQAPVSQRFSKCTPPPLKEPSEEVAGVRQEKGEHRGQARVPPASWTWNKPVWQKKESTGVKRPDL